MKIDVVLDAISRTEHKGCEQKLHDAVVNALFKITKKTNAPRFSPNINEYNKNITTGIGSELGFILSLPGSKKSKKSKCYYVDIADVNNFVGFEVSDIKWLCEIKVLNPKTVLKGKYYPWIYNYDTSPPEYNFLQNYYGDYFITNADEGQIFFDLTKMLALSQKINNPNIHLYQILAFRDKAPTKAAPSSYMISDKYVINSLCRIFDTFNQHIKKFKIVDYIDNDLIALANNCTVSGKIVGAIAVNSYHHIILEWTYCLDEKDSNISFDPKLPPQMADVKRTV